MPIPETRGDTGGDGDHVLHRSGDLAADDVVARVDPQTVPRPGGRATVGAGTGVGKRHAGRRWLTGHDLPRQVRSADHADEPRIVARQLVDDHLGHPQAGLQLEPLGGADDERTRPHPPVRCEHDVSQVLRRHGEDHDTRPSQCHVEPVGRFELSGERVAGQEPVVAALRVDGVGDRRLPGPDRRRSSPRQDRGDVWCPRPAPITAMVGSATGTSFSAPCAPSRTMHQGRRWRGVAP